MTQKFCCICNSSFENFLPWDRATESPFLDMFKCVGSDIKNFFCPNCKATDRDRHLWLYLNKLDFFGKMNSGTRVMHIAAERILLENLLRRTNNIIIGDLFPEKYNYLSVKVQKIDLTGIDAPDNSFNLFIANHVLEHITDYKKALKEINRILIEGGIAILQTPYSPVIYKNFEDPLINTDEKRNLYYGQADHVRIFGLQLFDDIKEAGFNLSFLEHNQLLADISPDVYGVNHQEGLILAIKNNRAL